MEPVLPFRPGPHAPHYTYGVRAGRWLFMTGILAQGFDPGPHDGWANQEVAPLGASPSEQEATALFDNLDQILAAGGTTRDNLVRLDQFFTNVSVINSYQTTRRKRLGTLTPASTSVVVRGLALANASMQLDALAVIPSSGFQPHSVRPPDAISVSGPSPIVTVGDFVFISGQLATADPGADAISGLSEDALVRSTTFWGGQPIRVETEYVLERRISPALDRAGSSRKNVVKAQVFLTDLDDLYVFRRVWSDYFCGDLPATTIIVSPQRSLGIAAAKVEINLIALRDDAAIARKQIVSCAVAPMCPEFPAAVKAGDLLFMSGLMANDGNVLAKDVASLKGRPFLGSMTEAEARIILDKAEAICAAAGTSLAHVVRAQHFHTALWQLPAAYSAWRERLANQPLPISAIEIPKPLPIEGSGLLMDLWVYAPQRQQ